MTCGKEAMAKLPFCIHQMKIRIFTNMKKVVNIGDNCVILVYNRDGQVVIGHVRNKNFMRNGWFI